ncbi:DNA-binding transcriptional LysR family regulator [Rhodobium orientis]|uniref:LysR family transcriptional regulator n=1 Tax=Rhodobium orientis TaxID=34017 RepID=A0A327JIP6_9HYPH|nr:LysR substrate-binding domain-containing protein [Rhodobium orientis]MBB4302817.1 DNA-binding transcriptional LysR family regulator [Rhodobium orientis]MBK5948596.1 LysR family transcriptional regulator [Rhodobium orientis]RAI26277.1 LysR family transcriptional regulator [Rhodobium orientis]
MQQDLNDLAYFAEVVAHRGFAPASRAIGEPKSKLSRRIAALEERLGVRLIERSSRRFRVTDIGQQFYERCRSMQSEADEAHALVAEARAEPHGLVRFGCPTGLVDVVVPLITDFLSRHPKVRLQLVAADRALDLISERIDLALRVRAALDSDASLTMRTIGTSIRILVATPRLAKNVYEVEDLDQFPLLSTSDSANEVEWNIETDKGETRTFRKQARMGCTDFSATRMAAKSGLGVALLPDHVCRAELAAGELVRILPEWRGQKGIVHLVFTTRRGLPPAVRLFIDHLARGFPQNVLSNER